MAEIFLQLQERRIRDQLLHLIMAAATIIIIIIIIVVICVILFIFISVIVASVVDTLALFGICLFLFFLQRVLVFFKDAVINGIAKCLARRRLCQPHRATGSGNSRTLGILQKR
jgi:hypothetical protein